MAAKKRIEIIEYFKGLSFICIFIYHLVSLYMKSVPPYIRYMANAGSSGVLIFFMCSGYVLTLSYYNNHRSTFEFLKRRFITIYIPYIFVVFICFLIPLIQVDGNRIIAFLSHLFQFRFFSTLYFESFGGHFWYISTIIQFYLLFIPLYRLMKKIGWKKFLIGSFIVQFVYIILLAINNLDANIIAIRLFPKYIAVFCLGMALCDYYRDDPAPFSNVNKKYAFWVGILLMIVYGLSSKNSLGRLFNDIPELFGVLLLFIFLYQVNIFNSNEFIQKLSTISYEEYLVHMPIMTIIFSFSKRTFASDVLCAALSILLTVIFSILLHKLVQTVNKKILAK